MKRRLFLIGFTVVAFLLLAYVVAEAQAPGYAGSDQCAQCHGAKYDSYQHTWHAKVLRPATSETVLGDFSSADSDLTFDRDDIVYAVGGQFSQRYLTEIDGELYVLPAQWNVLDGKWVAYHPDDWQERPYRQHCAGCHTTGFDAASGQWAEDGVQCEACHGPGLGHVALAGDTAQIVNPALLEFDEQTEICGQCHLRGRDLSSEHDFPTDYRPGGPLSLDEAFVPVTDDDAFWPDGSSRRHHQEYQDWKLSGHADGVACAFCHVSHSSGETRHQTRFVGNHRCVICHEDKKDLSAHIPYHPLGEMVCTDCHMPVLAQASAAEAEYNFDIHGHTFWPPNPARTAQEGGPDRMPNACNLCHDDKSPEWAARILGLEVEAVSLDLTATPVTPPTPVPTVTPFMGLSNEELETEHPSSGNLFLWAMAGLGFLAVVVALILIVQRPDRAERKAA
jgi:hypothetical protein